MQTNRKMECQQYLNNFTSWWRFEIKDYKRKNTNLVRLPNAMTLHNLHWLGMPRQWSGRHAQL